MFAQLVRLKALEKNVKMIDIATKIGNSQQNFSQKMKRDNFTEQEMRDISKVLGFELEIKLK